jgi:hypothetical protein
MISRCLSAFFLTFLLASSAGAEEIAMTYAPVPKKEKLYSSVQPVKAAGESAGWEGGAEVLTGRALTIIVGSRLATIDRVAGGDAPPDTFYFDANGNRSLDIGETFPIVSTPGAPKLFHVEKVALNDPVAGRAYRGYASILFFETNDGRFFHGISPWGHMRWEGTFGGRPCRMILRDENINGVFGDIRRGPKSRPDSLTVFFDGEEKTTPLRNRMVIGGKAYCFDALNNGGILLFDSMKNSFGTVTVPAEMMEVELYSPALGTYRVKHGCDEFLPEGTYNVASFVMTRYLPFARCSYKGPPDLEVVVTAEKTTSVTLETMLIATITPRVSRGAVGLSVTMVTPQGACFDGYAATSAVRGVPFTIVDGAGRTIVDDSFTFG